MKFWRAARFLARPSSRSLSITCRGQLCHVFPWSTSRLNYPGTSITRDKVFEYTNGRFLTNETKALARRYLKFNIDELCAVASSVGSKSAVNEIEKMEGGFSKALLLRKRDGSEVIAKLPFKIAGPPKYLTASEVAVLEYLHEHTKVPVPKVLAWSSDPGNMVGAEYIIMEKAAGTQMVKKWGQMEDIDHFTFVENLCAIEAQMASVQFPVNGSLYLRESMIDGEKYEPLNSIIDPNGRFCIGPSCERDWSKEEDAFSEKGPWSNLPTFGTALVQREMARLSNNASSSSSGQSPPRNGEDPTAVLKIAGEVIERMCSNSLPGKYSRPTLWHTDLHLGNIYVSDQDPTQIVSIIDWQSVVIAPLFYQVRFPEFLHIDEDYETGGPVPYLPDNIDEMDEDDRDIVKYKHKMACLAKAYEAATRLQNKAAHCALLFPLFFRDLFERCGEASEEGIVPLRACLIEIYKVWDEADFEGRCPLAFTEEDIRKHEVEFEEYSDYHRIQGIARKLLGTDSEGWISPGIDFEHKRRQNQDLKELIMGTSAKYNKTPGEISQIWPF